MIYDIAIIGAGPVGLFVPFVAGMKKLSCILFDTLTFVGGQCAALYPEKLIYDIPSVPSITAQDLIANLLLQSQRFNPSINLDETILSYTKNGDNFLLTTSKNRIFEARKIVIATGGGRFVPNRPPIANIEEYENKGVFYSVRSKGDFASKKIAIAGGGDSAVDWAIALGEVASKIYFIHRRDKFKAAPDSIVKLEALKERGILEFITPFQLESIMGEGGFLKTLTVKSLAGEIKNLDIDVLLPFFGLTTDSSLLDSFKIQTLDGCAKVNQSTMETSIDGIYAVGDIAIYEKKLKLILTGFAEVATCVYDIKSKFEGSKTKLEHSTTLFSHL